MRREICAAALLAACITLWACAPANAPAASLAEDAHAVEYTTSGGFAGLRKRLTIAADGRVIAEDLQRHTHNEQQLSASERNQLERFIADAIRTASTATQGSRLRQRCADCFQYRLDVSSADGTQAIQSSGELNPDSPPPNIELLRWLGAMLNRLQP